ncbi:MAG: hypothetical protein ACREBY_18345 [Polaromonas sp.]
MIIGIDPDTKASGVAILQAPYRLATVVLDCLGLVDLFALLKAHPGALVALEAGWLNAGGMAFLPGHRRAINVGMNHAIGRQIAQVCGDTGMTTILWRPTGKKWDHKRFIQLTGLAWGPRTNQEERDAVRVIVMSSVLRLGMSMSGNQSKEMGTEIP